METVFVNFSFSLFACLCSYSVDSKLWHSSYYFCLSPAPFHWLFQYWDLCGKKVSRVLYCTHFYTRRVKSSLIYQTCHCTWWKHFGCLEWKWAQHLTHLLHWWFEENTTTSVFDSFQILLPFVESSLALCCLLAPPGSFYFTVFCQLGFRQICWGALVGWATFRFLHTDFQWSLARVKVDFNKNCQSR